MKLNKYLFLAIVFSNPVVVNIFGMHLKENLLSKHNNNHLEALIDGIETLANADPDETTQCLDSLIEEGKIDPISTYIEIKERNLGANTLIGLAARSNNISAINLLCNKYKAPLNNPTETPGEFTFLLTPLIWACRAGHADTARTLIQFGADVNLGCCGKRPPLYWVNNPSIIDILVQSGANINAQDDYLNTPLMNYLTTMKLNKSTSLHTNAKKILEYSGHDFTLRNSTNQTTLSLALNLNDHELTGLILQAIKKQSLNPDHIENLLPFKSNELKKRLLQILSKDCPTLKKRMLEVITVNNIRYEQANVPEELNDEILNYDTQALNIKNNLLLKHADDYLKALVDAIETLTNLDPEVSTRCFDLLIAEGNIDPTSTKACMRGFYRPDSLLAIAAHSKNATAINLLCDKYQMPVNEFDNQLTPLIRATGCVHSVRELLRFGADPNLRDSLGETPLHWARNPAVIDILVQSGADLNAQTEGGYTPIMSYIVDQSIDSVKTILAHPGHDFTLKNYKSQTPLDLAKQSNNSELIQLVQQAIEKQVVN